MSSPRQTPNISTGRRIFFALILVLVLGLTLFLSTRHRPLPAVPLPEVHLKNLELRADGWYTPGTTTKFTGILIDTYDQSASPAQEELLSPSLPQEERAGERKPVASEGPKVHVQLKSRSSISNGLLHGLSQGWYTNGQQQVEEHFVAGTSHGPRTKWHPNGQKLSEVNIVSGKLEGTFRSWHENGAPAEEVELTNSEPDGLSKAWFSSGFLKSQVTMRNGKIVERQFYKDGEYRRPTQSSPARLSSN